MMFCCTYCEKLLHKSTVNSSDYSSNYPFKLNRLWAWNHKNNQLLKPLIHGLKGGRPFKEYYTLLARKLYLRKSDIFDKDTKPLIIPAPSKDESEDHAGLLARCLSDVSGAPLTQLLNYPQLSIKNQKIKNRSQRHELVFEKVTISNANNKPIIFVDDVVTSGATVQAAYIALNLPPIFEVWALAEKELERL